jgi:RecA-family ATPase
MSAGDSAIPFPITSGTEWAKRDLPAPDSLLGELLSTTRQMMLIGPTGLGKTNLLLAPAIAIAAGAPLPHWTGSGKPRRVLFIDGEMSNRLLKRRLDDAFRRAGRLPQTFHALSRVDAPDMPPLDTPAGQRFIDRLMEHLGGFDLVIFDNIKAVTVPEDDFGVASRRRALPWVQDLTRRAIGQVWVHHTGNNETKGYGTKSASATRRCGADGRIERPEADVCFRLKFTEARERTPDNRGDFEPAIITPVNDCWESERGTRVRTKRTAKDLALAGCGKSRPIGPDIGL